MHRERFINIHKSHRTWLPIEGSDPMYQSLIDHHILVTLQIVTKSSDNFFFSFFSYTFFNLRKP